MAKYLIAIVPLASVGLGNAVFNAVGWEGNNFSVNIARTSDAAPYKALGTWVSDEDVLPLAGLSYDARLAASEITETEYADYTAAVLVNISDAPAVPQNIFAAFLLDNGLEIPYEEV